MKKIIATYLFVLIGSISYSSLSACTCAAQDNFCATAVNASVIIASEVVSIQAEEYTMQVAILENLHNGVSADTLLIAGGNGADCGENVELFTVGDTMIFALNAYDNKYFISICGLHYLSLKSGMVSGKIHNDLSSQSYEEFKANLATCINITSVQGPSIPDSQLRITPNPATEKVNIQFSQGQIETVEVFSYQGQMVARLENQSVSQLDFPIANLDPGIYLFRIWQGDHFVVKRVVKM